MTYLFVGFTGCGTSTIFACRDAEFRLDRAEKLNSAYTYLYVSSGDIRLTVDVSHVQRKYIVHNLNVAEVNKIVWANYM